MSRLAKDWPAYILLIIVAWFYISVIIHGRRQEKDNHSVKEK